MSKPTHLKDPIIVTSFQKKRRWSDDEKKSILQEAQLPENTVSGIARKYDIPTTLLFRWRKEIKMKDKSLSGPMKSDNPMANESQIKALTDRIRSLEQILGRKTVEIEMLKDAIQSSGMTMTHERLQLK